MNNTGNANLQKTLSLNSELIKPFLRTEASLWGKVRQFLFVFMVGASGYILVELMWRGRTHWTMAVTGGICFLLIYIINNKCRHKKLWQKCIFGALTISGVEFIVGAVVNLWLGWRVWDYSKLVFNFLGQVSLQYSFFWFLLCIPLSYFSAFIYKKLNKA